MTPTSLSLRLLRDSGYVPAVVESWIPGANLRRDLFGIGDILAVPRAEQGTLLVQCTTLSNVSARVNKAKGKPELAVWIRAGQRFEVWGWFLRDGQWQVKRVELRGEDLDAVVVEAPRRRRKADVRTLFDAVER